MSVSDQPISGLPVFFLAAVAPDTGCPVHKDYSLECGSQAGSNMDSTVDRFVLLKLGRGAKPIAEINLEPDQARTLAAQLLELADACDKGERQ